MKDRYRKSWKKFLLWDQVTDQCILLIAYLVCSTSTDWKYID